MCEAGDTVRLIMYAPASYLQQPLDGIATEQSTRVSVRPSLAW